MPAERRSTRLASIAPTASPATSPRRTTSARKPTSSRKPANRKKPATRKTLSSQPADSEETPSGNYEITFRQLCEECPSECGSSSEESDEGFDAMRGHEYYLAQGLTTKQIRRRYARRIRKLGKTVESMEQEVARSENGQCWVEQTEEMDVEPIKPVRRGSEETSSSEEEESSSDSDSGMEY